MDSLFDIIIGIVIVYSLLSPFFSKKKGKPVPQNKRQEFPGRVNPPLPPQRTQNTPPDDFDILREVENLFKETRMEPLPVPPKKQIPENYKTRESQTAESLKDKWKEHVQTVNEKTSSESSFPKFAYTAPVVPVPVMKFEPLPEVHHYGAASEVNSRVKAINARLRNSANLRDYFIVSEILGKPKAYRRRSVY